MRKIKTGLKVLGIVAVTWWITVYTQKCGCVAPECMFPPAIQFVETVEADIN